MNEVGTAEELYAIQASCRTCEGQAVLPCEACGGSRTEHRPGSGKFAVPEPARWFVTQDVREVLRAADLAKNGHLPLPGGWMAQTEVAIQAIRAVWYDSTITAQDR